jgi:superfamily II DNA/RNA helicase
VGIGAQLELLGITTPSQVQVNAFVKIAHESASVLISAPTGTGKTLAFLLPLLTKLLKLGVGELQRPVVRALMIVPTRELVMQMRDVLLSVLPPDSGITVGLAIGGEPEEEQRAGLLARPPTIILGTPTRLFALFAKDAVAEEAERQQFAWPARLQHTFSVALENRLPDPLLHIETIVVDEADSVLKPLPAHAR